MNRTLIEAGDLPENNSGFVSNLAKFLDDHKGVNLNRVLITHAHPDHFGGLSDVLDLLK
jgi:glyoxylase-like metal-dependent hydrolase (beta-lactamase superfamily II)